MLSSDCAVVVAVQRPMHLGSIRNIETSQADRCYGRHVRLEGLCNRPALRPLLKLIHGRWGFRRRWLTITTYVGAKALTLTAPSIIFFSTSVII